MTPMAFARSIMAPARRNEPHPIEVIPFFTGS
jgi:hypothetical protein